MHTRTTPIRHQYRRRTDATVRHVADGPRAPRQRRRSGDVLAVLRVRLPNAFDDENQSMPGSRD